MIVERARTRTLARCCTFTPVQHEDEGRERQITCTYAAGRYLWSTSAPYILVTHASVRSGATSGKAS